MKKYIIAMFACCWVAFCSCSDNDKLPNIRPTDTGEYTDKRDGNTYGWVRIGDFGMDDRKPEIPSGRTALL